MASATSATQSTLLVSPLTSGNSGADVRDLQIKLNQFYGPVLQVDGIFGPETTTLVWAFQSACQLAPNGIVGEKTWSYLNELTPYVGLFTVQLSIGSAGSAVKYLQARLNSYFTPQPTQDYQPLSLDGVFGQKTETEVKRFQAMFSLPVDGIADADLMYYLELADMSKNHHE
ncbi:MAG: peptidoglycan-binding protein [Cyanothece sp. SIO2G6]|nr:peptidoglycan-binding protein [Cyanothece sp. SIO2G6]